jgi:alpha-beta hydrolase superfamily lysophospholipase
MQMNTQFLTVGTIITAAMTAGLAYVVNIDNIQSRKCALLGFTIVSIGFSIGAVIAHPFVARYRSRLNDLARLLNIAPVDELAALATASRVAPYLYSLFTLVIAYALLVAFSE